MRNDAKASPPVRNRCVRHTIYDKTAMPTYQILHFPMLSQMFLLQLYKRFWQYQAGIEEGIYSRPTYNIVGNAFWQV